MWAVTTHSVREAVSIASVSKLPIPASSWGCASFTALRHVNVCDYATAVTAGHSEAATAQPLPRVIKDTQASQFVRVAAGATFSVGLTRSGQVWSWGQDDFGALGKSAFSATGCVLAGNAVEVS